MSAFWKQKHLTKQAFYDKHPLSLFSSFTQNFCYQHKTELLSSSFPTWAEGHWEDVFVDSSTLVFKDRINFKTYSSKVGVTLRHVPDMGISCLSVCAAVAKESRKIPHLCKDTVVSSNQWKIVGRRWTVVLARCFAHIQKLCLSLLKCQLGYS